MKQKILFLSLLLSILFSFNSFAQNELVTANEVNYNIYYENENIEFRKVDGNELNILVLNDEVYLPFVEVFNLFGYDVIYNKDRNAYEAKENNNVIKYIDTDYENNLIVNSVSVNKLKDTRLTINGVLINLENKDDFKSYLLDYNGNVYISVDACKIFFFIDMNVNENNLYINKNNTLYQFKEEYFNLINSENPLNEVVQLNTRLNSFDESHVFCDYIEKLYFYGDNHYYFNGCAFDKATNTCIVSINPFRTKEKMVSNLGLTDFVFEFTKQISINSSMTDREKVRVLNKWVVDNYIYDEHRYAKTFKDLVKTKYAICGGYSVLFRELAEFYGLDCESLTGAIYENGKPYYHAWNKVLVDNVWYYSDSCWNDDNPNYEEYLFLTEEEMNWVHNY